MARQTRASQVEELKSRIASLEAENVRLRDADASRIMTEKALLETRERFQTLFNNALELIYIHDFEGNFIDANDRALQLFGYTRSDLSATNLAHLLRREDLPRAMGATLEVLKKRASSVPIEFQARSRDGSWRWFEVSGVRLDQDGMPWGVLGIGRDVTDRKATEQALRESESRFRSMFDNSAELIYVYDLQGRFVDANERTVSTLGYAVTELVRIQLQDIVEQKDVPAVLEDIRVILESGSLAEPSTYRLRTKDGKLLTVEVSGVRLSWVGGTSVILSAARDISTTAGSI